MIRRRRRTAKQASLLRYKQEAAVAIGLTRQEETDAAAAHEAAVITAVHAYIWATRHVCQLCGGRRRDECHGRPDQMHEDPPRSKTRGLPPEQRFNLLVCARLCACCHDDVTANRLRIVFEDSTLGFLGKVCAAPYC